MNIKTATIKNFPVCAVFALITCICAGAQSGGKIDTGWQNFSEKLAQADRLEIYLGYPDTKSEKIFESEDPKDIREFMEAAKVIVPDSPIVAGTMGNVKTIFYKDGKKLISVENIGAQRIRCMDFSGDAYVVDADSLAKWFDDRGVYKVRKDLCRDIALRNIEKAGRKHWERAMPKSFEPFWNDKLKSGGRLNEAENEAAQKAVWEEFPDENERVLMLLKWYGANNGIWGGCLYSYESIPYFMLTDIQDTRIASIAEENELDEDQLEGAARFFISRTNTDLSPELKQKLLKHALESTDENKIFQAKRVFQD